MVQAACRRSCFHGGFTPAYAEVSPRRLQAQPYAPEAAADRPPSGSQGRSEIGELGLLGADAFRCRPVRVPASGTACSIGSMRSQTASIARQGARSFRPTEVTRL